MIPDTTPAARPAPNAVLCERVRPRRVFVRDPYGVSLLRGAAELTEVQTLGGAVWACGVAFANGVTATVPPTWITDLPPEPAGNVVPFPVRR